MNISDVLTGSYHVSRNRLNIQDVLTNREIEKLLKIGDPFLEEILTPLAVRRMEHLMDEYILECFVAKQERPLTHENEYDEYLDENENEKYINEVPRDVYSVYDDRPRVLVLRYPYYNNFRICDYPETQDEYDRLCSMLTIYPGYENDGEIILEQLRARFPKYAKS